MFNWLKNRGQKSHRVWDSGVDLPAPVNHSVIAIGDVHGRHDLLVMMLEFCRSEFPNHDIVLLGDVIDRGPDSAAVLRYLAENHDVATLMGNHEKMCLDFMLDPEEKAALWLTNGGADTLDSYGIDFRKGHPIELRNALITSMGGELARWLAGLKRVADFGSVVATHAGADPKVSIRKQNEKSLLWGRGTFSSQHRKDGLWIVQGHRIVEKPVVHHQRIMVDTGAFQTGQLSAAVLDSDNPHIRFMQVQAD
jgi:serine/threonine protein phosphatase 1